MKIGIVGLGLIGGCLGLDLRQIGHQVYGVSRRQATCDVAIATGAVDGASLTLSSLASMDLIFVCTPINAVVPTVIDLADILTPEAIVTDVGSVKGAIVQPATQSWPRFVGGHPMSGKAEAGISAAETRLFNARPYVITPIAETDPAAVEQVSAIATALGSKLYFTDPTDHDRAVAWISHLPVMVSASLIQACLQESNQTVRTLAQQLASSGFRDTSRVGGGPPELGLMMAKYNRQSLLNALTTYREQLDGMTQAIETENWERLAKILEKTQTERPHFNGV